MKSSIYVIFFIYVNLAVIKGDFFQNALRNVVYENSYQINVSETCSRQLQAFAGALQEVDVNNVWAWKMIDATAKLQSGILEGNLANLGHFDECIDTSANTSVGDINGKYCLGSLSFKSTDSVKILIEEQLKVRKKLMDALQGIGDSIGGVSSISLQWAACLPDGCTAEEMGKVYDYISDEYLNGAIVFKFSEELCQTKESSKRPLTSGAITAITIFSIILTLVLLSTVYDLYLQFVTKSKPPHLILVAFSAYTNADKLFTMTPNNPDMMPCLNGLRVISMMWVVIGHQYSTIVGLNFLFNALDFTKWLDTWHSMYARGATVAVDTFFVLSGLLMTYGFMKSMSKGIPFNIPLYWLHRYLRLTPALAAAILLEGTLIEYLGSGPIWPSMAGISKNCQEYWWSTLLYVQNYVNIKEMCVGQTWYLSVDMQLFILSPLILIPLWRWKRKTLIILFLVTLISIAIPFGVAWEYDLIAVFINPLNPRHIDTEYMNKYYLLTHTRATPWFIGVFMGYVLFNVRKRGGVFKLNRILVLVLWAASLAVLTTCVFAGYDTLKTEEYDKWPNVSYVVFVRPAWAIALSWLIFACVTGNGGCINWFLSFPVYQVLARLTYSVYLLHIMVIYIRNGSTRLTAYFSDYDNMYMFWGTTMFTCALAIVWILAFESPMITIEKVLLGGKAKPKPQTKPTEETLDNVEAQKC